MACAIVFFPCVFGTISFVKVMLCVPKLYLCLVLCLLSINVLMINAIVFLFVLFDFNQE
jgi:hypothetical protein